MEIKHSGKERKKRQLSPLAEELRKRLKLLSYKKKLLVAVSGGADSAALLHLLLEAGYTNLIIAHFNHLLRGSASNADARFVKRLAARLHLPFELGSADVRKIATEQKLSLETAARQARYSFFAASAKMHGSRTLLLAHHADDQVETCFFQFLRGSGAAGLAGMKPCSERAVDKIKLTLYRPLLSTPKQQLLDYLLARKLPHREDASNTIADASRNKLRLQVLPVLEEHFGNSFRASIIRNASVFAEEDSFLSSLALPMAGHEQLQVKTLRDLHPALLRRVLHAWLKNHGIEEPGFAEVERIASLLEIYEQGVGPAKINLPGNRHARRRAGMLFIE